MSSGRAASAITSGRAKQELVRLLFPPAELSRQRQSSHLRNSSKYTYKELRTAYLQKLHEIHPDKTKDDAKLAKGMFVELQTAWMTYEQLCKPHRQSSTTNDGHESDFTMFGVGCSFSDTEQEKLMRSDIMDQACRGWFSSGLITEQNFDQNKRQSLSQETSSLFTQMEEELPVDDAVAKRIEDRQTQESLYKSSLLTDQIPPSRRRTP
jgi:hypothetical protein